MNWFTAGSMAIALGMSLGMAGCAQNLSSDSYSRGQVGQVSQVDTGRVISVRQIQISGTKSGIGAGGGAIAGGAAGSQIGQGAAANVAGAVGGAIIGGLIGAAVEEGVTKQTGYEYTIELDNGRTVAISTADKMYVAPGTRVQVIYGERARVVPLGG